MKKIFKILFILIILFTGKIKISALKYGGCDYSTVANLKSLVNNINISYTYEIRNNKAYFNVTLSNIPSDVYFIDSNTKKEYLFTDAVNGEITIKNYSDITDGQYRFFMKNDACSSVKLGSKYYKFPIYNTRFNSDICKDISSLNLCKRWVNKYYSDYEFEKRINEYKETDPSKEIYNDIEFEKGLIIKIFEFYARYYYYFLPIIIIISVAIMFVYKKKNSFKL